MQTFDIMSKLHHLIVLMVLFYGTVMTIRTKVTILYTTKLGHDGVGSDLHTEIFKR